MVSFSPRPKLLVGWEVLPSFSVSQNNDRAEVIYLIKDYFGCGNIRPDKKTLKFETKSITDIRERILPHFHRFPLLSGKRRDYELFSRICGLIARKRHLNQVGLRRIVNLAFKMNLSGKRRYAKEHILKTLR